MTEPDARTRFSPLHTWARAEGGDIVVGITAYAEYELGELQYVGTSRVGTAVAAGAAFGEVESVKTASDLLAPCAGEIVTVNAAVLADPALVNRDPYGAGWIVRLRATGAPGLDTLLDRAAYDAVVAAAEH